MPTAFRNCALAVALSFLALPTTILAQRAVGTRCAFEGEVCKVPGTQDVSYGAKGSWITKTVTGSIQCGVAGFGKDPLYGQPKSCEIKTQKPPAGATLECAAEGERCAFLGTSEVAYGAGNQWVTKTATKSIVCGVAAFGTDPAPNVHKTCVVVPTRCAGEGELCAFSGIRTVKYGANEMWATKTLKNGATCGVDTFGTDPAPNVLKQCYLAVPEEKPINQVMRLGTHNAIASTHYGIFIQNSQRDSIAAQLDRGARSLEIDIVHDQPPAYAEGVYICHCGKAPHSLSLSQTDRWLRGDAKNGTWLPITPIDGWTHPTPYTRFSKTLGEIDQWLIANPDEIVIVLIENNNVNTTQVDAEIELAGLKTGIYKHNGDKWPTKSSLVRKNQRLILQLSDDEARGMTRRGQPNESKYVTAKYAVVDGVEEEILQFGFISPAAYTFTNQYTQAKADLAREKDQFFVIGSFKSALTDETTSRAHNEYTFLLYTSAAWIALAPINRFLPSILQVNQIHMGDPLRFVNDMNGPDYLVSSKVETIGDKSGDSWQIRFENDMILVNAGITVRYYEDVVENGSVTSKLQQVDSGVLNPATGIVRMINIPRKTTPGKPISLFISMYSTTVFRLYEEAIPAGFVGSPVPCFAATGTLTSPKAGRCEQ